MKKQILILSIIAVFLVMPAAAKAETILGAVLATTNMGEAWPLTHAIDQSGLSLGYVSGVTNFDTYVATTTHASNPGADWVSNALAGWAMFDLGGVFLVDRAAVWNFGSGSGTPTYAIKDINLSASTDGISFNPLGSYTLTNPNGAPSTLAQILPFGAVSAQFIRMDVLTTYGDPAALGEIAFAQSPIPEPGSVLLLGTGLGVLGLAAWRRKK